MKVERIYANEIKKEGYIEKRKKCVEKEGYIGKKGYTGNTNRRKERIG